MPDMSLFRSEFYASTSKPLCLLTFDDGYYDFYENAFPILRAHQVPATVFLPTDFIGTNKWFWTDRLMTLFLQKERAGSIGQEAKNGRQRAEREERRVGVREQLRSGNGFANKIGNLRGSYETRLEKAIQILKVYRDEEIEEIIEELSNKWNVNPELPGRAFLSWDEVKEMAQSGLITFGSHTASHRILTTLKDDEIWDELIRSRQKLIDERVADPSFIPFCYPNGNYNEKIVRMVKEAGYSLAVTTEKGWNRFDADPFTLKRIGIHQDMTFTEAMFGCRIAGIF